MFKEKIFMLCFTMLMFTCCLGLSLPANADDGCGGSTAPSLPGNVERTDDYCSSKTKIIWNDANSTDNLARGSSRILTITDESGMGGPYTWSVSGTGFSLVNVTTTETSNTLITNGSACGSATITVTGCGGKTVTGYVRCTTGRWVALPAGTGCPWEGKVAATTVYSETLSEAIYGKYRVVQNWKVSKGHGGGAFTAATHSMALAMCEAGLIEAKASVAIGCSECASNPCDGCYNCCSTYSNISCTECIETDPPYSFGTGSWPGPIASGTATGCHYDSLCYPPPCYRYAYTGNYYGLCVQSLYVQEWQC